MSLFSKQIGPQYSFNSDPWSVITMMRRTQLGVLILALNLSSVSLSQESRDEKPDKQVQNSDTKSQESIIRDYDVVYTKASGQELKLDVARPSGEGEPLATIIVIHGGGWRGGNKESNRRFLDQFAAQGFVAVSPQYRLVPNATFPAQIHDVKAAVRWLKTNAGKYRIDPNRIGAMGFSAGGHLALMLGTANPEDGLEGDLEPKGPDSRIRAVVNYFGPTDLDADDIPDESKPLVDAFLGGRVSEKKAEASKASPLDLLTPNDAPILTFQGTKDPLVPHSQAIKLAEAMTEKGVAGRLELFIGEGHGWENIENTLEEATQFLEANLKKLETSDFRGRRKR